VKRRPRHSSCTHVGLVRKVNEDAVLSLPEQSIWMVADGMGGHDAGDLASQTLVEHVAAIPATQTPAARMHALRHAIHAAHADLTVESRRRGGTTIGATVVALLVTDGHFVAFWAGDSRLYRFRAGRIELLTSDHSVVGELVAAGQLSWDEADAHPSSNTITRAVGVGETLQLDKIRGDLLPGDRFLLCSDGLTRYANFSTLTAVLASAPLETVAERLLSIALAGGGADNISIIVVDFP
jgi:serine/threonine protein phosphatase PrpC